MRLCDCDDECVFDCPCDCHKDKPEKESHFNSAWGIWGAE